MSTETQESRFRRIAWDRVSFEVPEQWELASYRWPKPGQTTIELEDDYSVCLDGRWLWSDDKGVMDKFLKGMEARDGDLARRADHKNAVKDLPNNWSAFIYTFSQTVPGEDEAKIEVDNNLIYHATYLTKGFSASFQIQSTADSPLPMEDIGSRFIESFTLYRSDLVPWELFDISITMPKAFSLMDAQFSVGSKHLIFEQKKRTLHVWALSCADIILKDSPSLEHWCSGFLNSQGGIRSLVFRPGTNGLLWKRRFPMLITHREEIGAFCFHWEIRAFLSKDENRIVIWAFNYRKKTDLEWLPDWLEPTKSS